MKRHYDNQNMIRINKTHICMALTVVIAMFCFIGHAEAQDCYNTNRSNGITAMRNKDYDKAIRWFEVAKKCPDKPENNDLQSKIDECKDLKRQTSQVSEEKKKLDEEKRKLEEEKRKLEEEKKKLEKERKEEAKKKPEETKSSSTKNDSASGTANNNNNMLAQISDDFDGNSINSQYWTAIGNVKVSNGMVTISQSQTDKDMSLTTKDLAVPKSKKIVIERRFLNHKAKNYYYGGFSINLNGNLNEFVGINYFHGDYEKWYGTKITYKLDGKENRIDLRSTEFDTWITDKVIVDFAAGTMTYYLDNNLIATKTVPNLSSKNVSYYNVRFHSYGWWTGHYSNIDYIRIGDMNGMPSAPKTESVKNEPVTTDKSLTQISDDFNGNSLNSQYWTSKGDVKVSNGMVTISQSQTDKDMSIKTKDLQVPTSKKIAIERRFRNHKASNQYHGGFGLFLNGNDNEVVGINYYSAGYEGWYGTKASYKLNGKEGRIDLCSAQYDTWLTEKVIIDFGAGALSYYLDNNFIKTVTIPGLSSKNVTHYSIRYASYGWFTGHYCNMDYVKISDFDGNPSTASTAPTNNLITQLSDDFNGNSLNSQYWTSKGDVKVNNGMVTISQSQTDKDMSIQTKNLQVPTSKKIAVERRFKNHKANNQYHGGFGLFLNGNDNEVVGINYYSADYEKWYGTKASYKLNGKEGRIDLCSAQYDTWLTEKVIIDFGAGTLSYYLDNNFIKTVTIPGLSSKNVTHYSIRYASYGWWTGHYSNIDYIRISDVE